MLEAFKILGSILGGMVKYLPFLAVYVVGYNKAIARMERKQLRANRKKLKKITKTKKMTNEELKKKLNKFRRRR